MTTPTRSYLKVDYELRSAKQVERRMLLDALHKLSRAGFGISDYQYTGFGSTYFVDFILFHKILGIRNMWSVEHDTRIKKRVRFNRPFGFIKIKMEKASDVIPLLSPDLKHFLWLDYDDLLSSEILDDVFLAATHLSRESILLVTVDVEPPGEGKGGFRKWMQHFVEISGRYFPEDFTVEDFRESKLPESNVAIILRAIKAGSHARQIEFIPLFNFLYKDGHRMISMGGMLGNRPERRQIAMSEISREHYYCRTFRSRPCEIRVPKLTRKERLYLDSAMPCRRNWTPKDFELRKEDIDAYREIYRFFPSYAELLF